MRSLFIRREPNLPTGITLSERGYVLEAGATGAEHKLKTRMEAEMEANPFLISPVPGYRQEIRGCSGFRASSQFNNYCAFLFFFGSLFDILSV